MEQTRPRPSVPSLPLGKSPRRRLSGKFKHEHISASSPKLIGGSSRTTVQSTLSMPNAKDSFNPAPSKLSHALSDMNIVRNRSYHHMKTVDLLETPNSHSLVLSPRSIYGEACREYDVSYKTIEEE